MVENRNCPITGNPALEWRPPNCLGPGAVLSCPQRGFLATGSRSGHYFPGYRLGTERSHHCLLCATWGPAFPWGLAEVDGGHAVWERGHSGFHPQHPPPRASRLVEEMAMESFGKVGRAPFESRERPGRLLTQAETEWSRSPLPTVSPPPPSPLPPSRPPLTLPPLCHSPLPFPPLSILSCLSSRGPPLPLPLPQDGAERALHSSWGAPGAPHLAWS